jgi:ADP-ribose pyrophosphatase
MENNRSEIHEKKLKDAFFKKEHLYKGSIVNLRIDYFKKDGVIKRYEVVNHPPAVAIIPITNDGKIVLIKQYRRAADKIMYEIPAGILEKDENPTNAAQRELQEEIGYKANNLKHCLSFYLSPGFCDEYLHLYIGTDLEKSYLKPDDDEVIDVFEVSLDQALKLIKDNSIEDVKTILAIYHYLHLEKS